MMITNAEKCLNMYFTRHHAVLGVCVSDFLFKDIRFFGIIDFFDDFSSYRCCSTLQIIYT